MGSHESDCPSYFDDFRVVFENYYDYIYVDEEKSTKDSDVSKEYLRLYQCGCLDAEELDDIRKNGLTQHSFLPNDVDFSQKYGIIGRKKGRIGRKEQI